VAAVGFTHDTSSTIGAIQEILGNYNQGFPVIRELLQNADDAHATTLDIGWIAAPRGFANPLLKGPALFVLNNGRFEDSNEEAIRRISGSDKGSQDGAIGKFGRGLKSVFHLCEGFVYASSVLDGISGERWSLDPSKTNLLTPWDLGQYHSEWSTFDEREMNAIAKALEPFLPVGEPWFCVWVPLRRKSACTGCNVGPIQENEFPGDQVGPPQFLRDEVSDSCIETILSLPLLSSLRLVRYWLPDAKNMLQPTEVRFAEHSTHRRFVTGETEPGEWPLRGELIARTTRAVFAGHEVLLPANGLFDELKGRRDWPVQDVLHRDSKQKGEPHAAAVFLGVPTATTGTLRVADAVFLPVGPRPSPQHWPGSWAIDLLLHGYSFVNSNRTNIERRIESADTKQQLRAEWNAALRSRGVLPSILPALQGFVTATDMPVADVEELTLAVKTWLRQSNEEMAAVLHKCQWLPCVTSDGDVSYWLVSANQPFHEMPTRPTDHALPGRVFPVLNELAAEVPVTFEDMPRLAEPPVPWAPEHLTRMIGSVSAAEVFGPEAGASYFAAFLDANRASMKVLGPLLIQKLRNGLRAPGLAQLKESPVFRRTLGHIDRRLLLPFDDMSLPPNTGRAVSDVTAYFASVATAVLVLPRSVLRNEFPDGLADPDLSEADARALLESLAKEPDSLRSDTFGQIRTRLADTLFRMGGSAGRVATAEFGDTPLFRAWVAGDGDATVAHNHLERANAARLLLRRNSTGGIDPAPALFEAAPSLSNLTVVPDYVQVAGGDLLRCSLDACAGILLQARPLATVEQRVPFLQKLLESPTPTTIAKQAARYLLHGNPGAIGGEEPLVFGEMHGDVWNKLAQQALGDEKWRLVHGQLAAQIPERRHEEFGLERIAAKSVAELIRRHGPDLMECGDDALTDDDRLRVVRELHDSELLRALPMHRDVTGTFGPINSHTYVATGFDLPSELGYQVRLLPPLEPELEAKLHLTPWTPLAAIREALAHDDVGDFAGVILDCLASPGMADLDEETRSQLRGKRWLPLTAGGFAKPEDVVQIDGLEEHISRIAAKCGGAYYDVGMLDPVVRNHPGFSRLRGAIQTGQEALETLPLMIGAAAIDGYCLGPVELPAERIASFVKMFEGASMGVMEAAPLLAAALRRFASSTVATHLAAPLRGKLSKERFALILNHLAERHSTAGREHQYEALDWHTLYLGAARDAGLGSVLLNEVQLLNQLGKWRDPANLCYDYPNVAPDSLVDVRQAVLLGIGRGESPQAAGTAGGATPETPSSGEAGHVLRDFFTRWQNHCPPEAIGGFLAFLGDEPDVRQLAQRYLGQRDIEHVRDMVTWKPLPAFVGGRGEEVGEVMRQQYFVVELVPPGEPQRVLNLLHEAVSVPLAESLTSLIQNRLFHSYLGPGRRNLLRLYDVDPSTHDAPTLSAMLRASTFSIIADIYLQDAYRDHGPSELDPLWKDLEDTHLVDLRTAQEVILHHLLSSAKLLKIGHAPALRDLVRLEEAGVRGAIEGEKLTDERKRDRALRDAEQQRRDARTGLDELLRKGDRDTANALLEAVRYRIGDESQYRPTSVPFELFQNADDAAVERDELAGTQTKRSYSFVAVAERGLLTFGHQGRGINDFRTSNGAPERFRERDFHRDLEKMLMLGASDKGISERGQVTGKFGLGLKSVFLLTRKPRIASGRLAVDVVAGTFPLSITGTEYEQLVERRDDMVGRDGTLFELPVEKGRESDAAAAMEGFRRHAPLLVAFARRTNRITLRIGGQEDWLEWMPRTLDGAPGCQVGAVPGAASRELPAHALRLAAGESALLLGLDARGATHLPDWVPGIWVTAPTEEALGAGFAFNGKFELHAGRSQLASTASETNMSVAESSGIALARTLKGLADAAAAWDQFRQLLALGEDAEPYSFWESMLNVLARVQKPGEAFDVLRATLWGDTTRGAARLYGASRVLPSGLHGEHRLLLQARDVQHRVEGLLAEELIFSEVMALGPVREKAPPGTAIAQAVAKVIPLDDLVQGERLDLARALQWVFESTDYVAEPELASTLGQFLDASHLDERSGGGNQREAPLLRNLLNDVRFRASDRTLHKPRELVVGHAAGQGIVDDDELARAAFAPDGETLSTAYDPVGIQFFKLCRVEMSANSSVLVGWAKKAEGEKLDGFIKYWQKGRLRADVQDVVRDDPSWLIQKGAADRIETLVEDPRDVQFARAALGLSASRVESTDHWQADPYPTVPPLSKDEVRDGLNGFATWWSSAGAAVVREYESELFPDGASLLKGWTREQLAESSTLHVRMLWMRLFVLAASHTLGLQPFQHRGFLTRFEDQGWLELFAKPHSEWETGEIVHRLERYVESLVYDERYAYWMRLFVPLFQVSHYLGDYIELFLAADRDMKGDTSLDQFLTPARNPVYQGGGLRPAGIRAALGIGAHFVLREMARAEIIEAPWALQHCVVPRQRVLRLVAALGSDVGGDGWDRSRQIAQFLKGHLDDRWLFDKAFDIALYDLASDVGKQNQFFGRALPILGNEYER
jgi:hypothetical protein